MNQDTDQSANHGAASTPRARPQLFGAPAAPKPQNDFGPSILATIDGGGPRFSKRRSRRGSKLWLVMLGLPLVAGAVYVATQSQAPSAPIAPTAAKAVAPAASSVLVAAAPAPAASAVVPQAATIETVALPAVASAPVAAVASAALVAPSASAVPAALELAAPLAVVAATPPAKAAVPDAPKPKPAPVKSTESVASNEAKKPAPRPAAAKQTTKVAETRSADTRTAARADKAAPAPTAQQAAAKPASRGATPDTDAELLAAMLPHLQRMSADPTPRSPAYDKRCGQAKGKAADSCRVKFCNGRQGSDPACPADASSR